ncbi:tRNA lysidine(34) synthetase TilS [Caldisericum exile]|uniref:tRNA(Ile)-lysidine synthase n=1 Tax=Caldisericum exile (strain DSM 21853 / NBRC 104410 / AZM16c01) TaxID=511051 RepID=A0A7U6JFY6_CALEA|nr:tRNA lysidine(34) synthetase TilS [Caldisericum exile]BAL80989.1 tRNA(Ile)-lysidine synthase [Caldisericum exile AZM16c01]
MEEILEKVLKTIEKYKLIQKNEKVLLAVSGGIDSMTMLSIFHKIKDIIQVEIGVATFDHGIRSESKDEIKIVEEYSKKLQVPFFFGVGNALKVHLKTKRNLEDVAREQRLKFLREVKEANSFNKIALAHNKNDFVETFFMHLLKGSGLKGITSMLAIEEDLIRPLVGVTREEIENYAKNEGIPYIIDLSNYNLSYERNRLRYQILPLIKSSYPNFMDHVLNFSDIALNDENLLDKITAIELEGIKRQNNEYSINLFKPLSLSIKRRIIKELLGENANYERVNMIIEFIESNKKKFSIGKDIYVAKTGNSFYIEHGTPFTIERSYILKIPGITTIPEAEVKIISEILESKKEFDLNDKTSAVFDLNFLKFPISVRFRKEGDIIEIENGKKKLQDLFVDLKVRRDIRHKVPIVVDNDDKILWVCGVRRSTIAKIGKDTRKVLFLKIVPLTQNL